MNRGPPRVSMRYIMTIFICESWKAAFAGNLFTVTPQRLLLFTFLWGRRRSWALLSLPSFSGSLHHFERVRDKSALGCHGDRSTAETHLCNGFLLKDGRFHIRNSPASSPSLPDVIRAANVTRSTASQLLSIFFKWKRKRSSLMTEFYIYSQTKSRVSSCCLITLTFCV